MERNESTLRKIIAILKTIVNEKIDFKENKKGEPKITEVNAGRFLTASYVYYYLTDYNLPLLMVKTFSIGEFQPTPLVAERLYYPT